MNWATQYTMAYNEEKKFIKDGVDAIKKLLASMQSGIMPIGYDAEKIRLRFCRN